MSGKKRQTFNKMNRERAVREKRARKQEKKEAKKLAAQPALANDGDLKPDGLEPAPDESEAMR